MFEPLLPTYHFSFLLPEHFPGTLYYIGALRDLAAHYDGTLDDEEE